MKDNIGFILTFTSMMLTIILLHGCTSKSMREDTTGKLTCVGYCELDVANQKQSITTTENGKVVEESSRSSGIRSEVNSETGDTK